MKKSILYPLLFSAVALLGFSACDDFLDITPTGKVMPSTGEDFRQLLIGAYAEVPQERGLTTIRTDEVTLDKGSTEPVDLDSYLDIWTWNDSDPAESTIPFKWREYYHPIYIANYILAHQGEITGIKPHDLNQLMGEAYMLRAYMHFLLVNLYAEPYTHCNPETTKGVPIKLDTDINSVLARSTVAAVYRQVLGDIAQAKKYLNVEKWPEGYTYRFNVLSAEALLARTYLYMGRWEDAYSSAQKVLEAHGELEDMTVSAVLPNNYKSVEAILSLEHNMPTMYLKAGRVNTDLLDLYKAGDQRKNKFYKATTASIWNCQKGGTEEWRCTFRTAEFYLIAAEAALEDGDPATDPRTPLLTLMKKRYHTGAYPARERAVNAMSDEELRVEIQNERARELAYEGHRWFDLRRTTQPALVKKFWNDVLGANEEYRLEEGDSRYTLRLPAAAISANPGLAD